MVKRKRLTNFNPLFIDYVKAIFFNYYPKKFTTEDLFNQMPSFYKNQEMVNAAVHILLMREDLVRLPLTSETDEYQANNISIKRINEEKETDWKIKSYTKQNLISQRWPLKCWCLISSATIFLSAGLSYFISLSDNKDTTSSVLRTEQRRQTTEPQLQPETRKDSLPNSQ